MGRGTEKKIGKIPKDNSLVLLLENVTVIPAQQDDLNEDGHWEELAFQVAIAANSTMVIDIKLSDQDSLPHYEKRTQAYMGVSRKKDGVFQPINKEIHPLDHVAQSRPMLFQYERVGWENDKKVLSRI